MPYTKLLKRSFEIVRHQRALWILGFIFALFGGGGSAGGGGGGGNSASWSESGSDFGQTPFDGVSPALPESFDAQTLISLVLLFGCIMIGLAIFAFVIRNVALAGLIHGSERAAAGEELQWRELWRAGWSQTGRRLMGLKLLLGIPTLLTLLIVFIVGLTTAFSVMQSLEAGESPDFTFMPLILGTIGTLICLFMLVWLLTWVLGMIGNYAGRTIVLEERPMMEALREGWTLFKNNVVDTVIFSLILGVIKWVMGFVVAILVIIVGLVIGLPLFFFLLSLEFPVALTAGLLIPAVLLLVLFASMLYGPLLAYLETTWTLVWQHLMQTEKRAGPESPLAPGVG